jgi:hypothetical protein
MRGCHSLYRSDSMGFLAPELPYLVTRTPGCRRDFSSKYQKILGTLGNWSSQPGIRVIQIISTGSFRERRVATSSRVAGSESDGMGYIWGRE